MTLVGKKLQDIYDVGAETLADLEMQANEQFKQEKEEHGQTMKELSEKSSQSLRDKSDLLQAELRKSIDSSLAKLQKVQLEERNQNQAYVLSLITELKTRIEQMQSKLSVLRQSHRENVDLSFNVSAEQYSSNIETMKIDLTENEVCCTENLNLYGATMTDNLLRTFEQASMQEQGKVAEIRDSYFMATRERSAVMAAQSSSLVQAFSADCDNRLKTAKMSSVRATEEIESSVHSLLGTVEKHASHVEQQINGTYTELTDGHCKKVDDRLSNFADQLSTMHDGITQQLLETTEELSTELLSGSAQAQSVLQGRCNDSVNIVGDAFAAFKQRLEERLQHSRGQKHALENDKNRILVAIKNELLSIQDSFLKKITGLIAERKSELAGLTKSVEKKMLAAIDTCSEEIGSSAATVQKQIEDDVTKFLQNLSAFRKSAISEITVSAQGSLSAATAPLSVTGVESAPASVLNPSTPGETAMAQIVWDKAISGQLSLPETTTVEEEKTEKRGRRRKSDDTIEKQGLD